MKTIISKYNPNVLTGIYFGIGANTTEELNSIISRYDDGMFIDNMKIGEHFINLKDADDEETVVHSIRKRCMENFKGCRHAKMIDYMIVPGKVTNIDKCVIKLRDTILSILNPDYKRVKNSDEERKMNEKAGLKNSDIIQMNPGIECCYYVSKRQIAATKDLIKSVLLDTEEKVEPLISNNHTVQNVLSDILKKVESGLNYQEPVKKEYGFQTETNTTKSVTFRSISIYKKYMDFHPRSKEFYIITSTLNEADYLYKIYKDKYNVRFILTEQICDCRPYEFITMRRACKLLQGKLDAILFNVPNNGNKKYDILNSALSLLSPKGEMKFIIDMRIVNTYSLDMFRYNEIDGTVSVENYYRNSNSKTIEIIFNKLYKHVKWAGTYNLNKEYGSECGTCFIIVEADMSVEIDEFCFDCFGWKRKEKSLGGCTVFGNREMTLSIMRKTLHKFGSIRQHKVTKNTDDKLWTIELSMSRTSSMMNRVADFYDDSRLRELNGFPENIFYNYMKIVQMRPVLHKERSLKEYENVWKSKVFKEPRYEYKTPPCGIYFQNINQADNYVRNSADMELCQFFAVLFSDKNMKAPEELIPYIADKLYTDDELYDVVGITEKEKEFIRFVLRIGKANSAFRMIMDVGNKDMELRQDEPWRVTDSSKMSIDYILKNHSPKALF